MLYSPELKANSVTLVGDRMFRLAVDIFYNGVTDRERQELNFNADNTHWQYLALPIVPTQTGNTVTQTKVYLQYAHNMNVAYFDGVCLSREDAVSYTYNENGDLTSAGSSGEGSSAFTYSGVDLTGETTPGSGSWAYTYNNKHSITSAANAGVTG